MSTISNPAGGPDGGLLPDEVGGSVAVRSARPLVLSQALKLAIQLVSIPLLARLLGPADFGAVAVALAVVGFGEILRDAGLSIASVTARTMSQAQRSALFWLNVLLGIGVSLAVCAFAYPASLFFSNPPLAAFLAVLSLVFLAGGVGAQYRADLNRRMLFGRMAIVDIVSVFLGLGAAVLLAIAGAGPWALIAQPVVIALSTLVLVVFLNPWRPSAVRVRGTGVRAYVKFGLDYSAAQVIGFFGNNVDTFVLGLRASPYDQGIYNRSFQLAIYPLHQLKSPATAVSLPLLSRASDNAKRMGELAAAAHGMLAYTVLPAGLFVAASAPSLVHLVLGPDWSDASRIVAILAVAGSLQQISSVPGWMLTAVNAGDALRKFSLISLIVKTLLVIALVGYGIVGVAAGYLIAVCLVWPILFAWACSRTGVNAGTLLRSLLMPVLFNSVAVVGCFFLSLVVHDYTASMLLNAAVFVVVFGLAAFSRSARSTYLLLLGAIFGRRTRDGGRKA